MVKGSIRIQTQLETKTARKEVEQLYNDIQKLKEVKKEASGNDEFVYQQYKKEEEEIKKIYQERLKNAGLEETKSKILREQANALAALEQKYEGRLQQEERLDALIAQKNAEFDTAVIKYNNLLAKGKQEAESTRVTAKNTSQMSKFIGSAKNAAVKLYQHLGKGLLGAVKKVGSTIKNRILGGLKSATKSAEGMRKKFLKIGLALVGMRGIWAGIRQIVSSALSNNEKLQKQLTATKGVLGTALAPAIQFLTDALGKIVTFVDRIYSMFTGTSLIAKYNAEQAKKLADKTEDAADAAKEYNKQMASFDVANKLTDNNNKSSSSDSGSDAASFFEKFDLSNWVKNIADQIKAGDWEGVGASVAAKVVDALTNIDWEKHKAKASKLGKGIANFINGALGYKDENGNTLATSIGTTLGEAINTAINFLYSFISTLKWDLVGKSIADGFSAFIKTIDWDKIIKTAYKAGEGLTKLLLHLFTDKDSDGDTFLSNSATAIANIVNAITKLIKGAIDELNKQDKNGKTGWQKIGESFADALNKGVSKIKWSDIGEVIGDGIKGVLETLDKFLKDVDGKKVGASIAKVLKNIDWGGIIIDILYLIADGLKLAFDTISGFFTELGNDPNGLKEKTKKFIEDFKVWAKTALPPMFKSLMAAIISIIKNSDTIKDAILEGFYLGVLGDDKKDTAKVASKLTKWFLGLLNPISSSLTWSDIVKTIFDKIKAGDTSNPNEKPKVEVSIIGKLDESFTKLKEKWDDIKDKTATLLADAKEKVGSKLTEIKEKFDGIFGKDGKVATFFADAKEKAGSKLTDIKNKITTIFGKDGKTSTIWANAKEKVQGTLARINDGITKLFNRKKKKVNLTVNVKEAVKGSIKRISDGIKKILGKNGKVATVTATFKDGVTRALKTFIGKINEFINAIKKLKIGTLQPFKNLPTIPTNFATGGIVNNPGRGVNAIVGEAGPEAILPLNDSTLSKLASLLNAHSGGQQVVVPVYLDGRLLARYTVDNINQRAFQLNKGVIR